MPKTRTWLMQVLAQRFTHSSHRADDADRKLSGVFVWRGAAAAFLCGVVAGLLTARTAIFSIVL